MATVVNDNNCEFLIPEPCEACKSKNTHVEQRTIAREIFECLDCGNTIARVRWRPNTPKVAQ